MTTLLRFVAASGRSRRGRNGVARNTVTRGGRREVPGGRRSSGWLAALATAGLLAAACSAGGDVQADSSDEQTQPADVQTATADASGAPQPLSEAWRTAVEDIQDDGTYSKDAALTLFAMAFGGMPGVTVPLDDVGPVWSGTMALRATMHHESELNEEQRRRLDEVLSLPDEGVSGAPIVAFSGAAIGLVGPNMAAAAGPTPEQRNLMEATARQIRQDIKARIGGDDLAVPITIIYDPRADPDLLRAVAAAHPRFTAGKYSECRVHVYPVAFRADQSLTNTLAHEITHCFQFNDETEATWSDVPEWIVEGSAMWVGDTLAPRASPDEWWTSYLTFPEKDLRRRSYDAIGFYAHLEETGHSPWAVFRDMWKAGVDSRAAWDASGANADDFLDTWAGSHLRRPALGTAWDTTGPNITTDHALATRLRVPDGRAVTVTAAPYTNQIYELEPSADIVHIEVAGHGRLADGSIDTTALTSQDYCTLDQGCDCPGAASSSGPPPLASGALLALTGGPAGATAVLQGRPVDEECSGDQAAWHFEAPSRYSAGTSMVVADAYTCGNLQGNWEGTLHITHDPAGANDPPLDVMVPMRWRFDNAGRAEVHVDPYIDVVFGRTHTLVYYPVLQLDKELGTIALVSLLASEDDGDIIDVTSEIGRVGEAIPLDREPPPDC